MFWILVFEVECVKLFFVRTKLKDCFLFVKKNLPPGGNLSPLNKQETTPHSLLPLRTVS